MLKPQNVTLLAGPYKLAAVFYLPKSASASKPAPGVIIGHGLGRKEEIHLPYAEYLAEQGFAALAFDWRGHGESAGNLDDHALDDVSAAIAYLSRRRSSWLSCSMTSWSAGANNGSPGTSLNRAAIARRRWCTSTSRPLLR